MSRLSSECVSGWQRAKQRHAELENPERQSMWLQSYSAWFASQTLNPVSCPLWREHKMLQVKPRTGRVTPWQHRPNSSAHKRRREGRERAERGRLHGVSRGKLSIYCKTVTHFIHSKHDKPHAGASRWSNKWLQAQMRNSIYESFGCKWEKVANEIGWPPLVMKKRKIYISKVKCQKKMNPTSCKIFLKEAGQPGCSIDKKSCCMRVGR